MTQSCLHADSGLSVFDVLILFLEKLPSSLLLLVFFREKSLPISVQEMNPEESCSFSSDKN